LVRDIAELLNVVLNGSVGGAARRSVPADRPRSSSARGKRKKKNGAARH
jgi:hypothetical protein